MLYKSNPILDVFQSRSKPSRYIENVFPGDFGVPEKWYFMFTKKYWTGTSDESVQTLSVS